MARVMPSQVVQTIDELFPHAAKNQPGHLLSFIALFQGPSTTLRRIMRI
jgi:hypothetical protein